MPGIWRSRSWRLERAGSEPSITSQMVSAITTTTTTPQQHHPFFLRVKRTKKSPREDQDGEGKLRRQESLEHILADKLLSKLFQDWAEENVCSENLQFYYEVEKYQLIKDPHFRKGEASRVYQKYVRNKAVAQVNLDYECRLAIEAELDHPTPALFDEAKLMVTDLIRYDLYLKFVNSDMYRGFKGLPNRKVSPRTPRRRSDFGIADQPHLSFEQISTLAKCLGDPAALDEFLKFSYNEFSDGLVQFYLDVNRYEVSPTVGFAREIYNKYLGQESEEEVDADPRVKSQISQQIKSGFCPATLFNTLKTHSYAVMVQDNFLRFQTFVISSLALV